MKSSTVRPLRLLVAALLLPACGNGGHGDRQSNSTGSQPPGVTLVSPSPGQQFEPGSDVMIEANTSDADGEITHVEFFQGATLLGTVTAPPFRWTWVSVPAGSYSITAVAADSGGAMTTSTPVSITVSSGGTVNQPPTVSITSPASGSSFDEGQSILLQAQASDPDGTVTGVQYFQGSVFLGNGTGADWHFAWTGASPATYSVRAVAADAGGASTSSGPVTITVTALGGGTTPFPTVDLSGVFFSDAMHGWISGVDGVVIATADGGATWSTQNSTVAYVGQLQFVNSSVGWGIAPGGLIRTTNGGLTWEFRAIAAGVEFRSLSFVSATIGWIVGLGGALYKTIDGGLTWTAQSVGETRDLFGVSFVHATKGWTVAQGLIYSTSDGGATWSRQIYVIPGGSTANAPFFTGVRFISETSGTLVGFASPSVGVIVNTADGGATWTLTYSPLNPSALNAVTYADGRHAWAVGSYGDIEATSDVGSTWVAQTSGVFRGGGLLHAVSFIDASVGWVVGDSGTVLKTTNGGSTWTLVSRRS